VLRHGFAFQRSVIPRRDGSRCGEPGRGVGQNRVTWTHRSLGVLPHSREGIEETFGYVHASPTPVSVRCKLLQPIVARPKGARAMVTIPARTVIELLPILRKGRITEVLWEAESFCTPLDDLLSACPRDDFRKVCLAIDLRGEHRH
jgi:hypothetical protein